MRIAELTSYTSRLNGGVFFALSSLLPEVSRQMPDGEVRVFGYADRHTEEDRAAWNPVQLEAFRPWRPSVFGYSPRFFPALESYRADLVHAHGLWTYLSAAALREHRRTGTPVVISPHGMLDPWALAFSRLRKRIAAGLFQNPLLRSAAVLHALTPAEARSIRAYGLPNPVVVIPNGVVLPTGEPGGPPWGASEAARDRVLLFLSRIHPKKGLDLLIEQWADFSRRGQAGERWRLVVAGWDEIGHEAELRKMVKARGLGESVDFVGPLFGSAKAAALAHADAFVLPSRSEGLPVAILEAWAHGKPVVMSTACNLPEGTACGAAIEVDQEPGSLASGLARLAALGDAGRGAMGAAGRRLVEERFCWTRIAEDMASVYRAVVNRAPIPPALIYPETS